MTNLPEAALTFLRAVDEGLPAGERARALALDVLRVSAPESSAWALAVAVLEGGELRLRRAVELAGEVLEASDEGSDDVCFSSGESSRAR